MQVYSGLDLIINVQISLWLLLKKYDNKSKLLFIDTDGLMFYTSKSKYDYDNSNKLFTGKMKDETRGVKLH